ncbi:MAG TPA: STAS domain-containing protein [Gaiellales bacterium]|nr:STAS domain-containing protein [Gaiellales bacterium]
MPILDVKLLLEPGTATVRCAGEIDVGTCTKLIDALERVELHDGEAVRVDLSRVTFIDSTGIGCLLHGALRAEKAGVDFEIVPSEAVERFVEVSGLGGHLRMVAV